MDRGYGGDGVDAMNEIPTDLVATLAVLAMLCGLCGGLGVRVAGYLWDRAWFAIGKRAALSRALGFT